MRKFTPFACLAMLAACSDVPMEEQNEGATIAVEQQIEGDAKSLEAAADEAVKVLKSEMKDNLESD
ncbi:MAG: hypothetical protein V7676_03835 [Parasphingorhabdus sp.]|uniref:hypothetical protein n=1 Tax=Parasphingorhabdus sp. TaxID=2709688 RepID=UPI003001E328